MTKQQILLQEYFDLLRKDCDNDFSELSRIKFSELFRFKGLLGQGSYGVVMLV